MNDQNWWNSLDELVRLAWLEYCWSGWRGDKQLRDHMLAFSKKSWGELSDSGRVSVGMLHAKTKGT